jgi:copper transport protein
MTVVKDRPRVTKTARKRRRLVGKLIAFSLLLLACWATLLAVASPVSTDVPVLRSSSPGVGSTIRPDNLVLTFDRPVDAGLATVRLTDPYHREIDPGRPGHAGGRAETISVPLPKQKYAGTYTVAWNVPTGSLAAASGTLTFDLASRSPAQEAPKLASSPSALVAVFYAVAQFGALAAVALLVGAVFAVATIWPAGADHRGLRRLVTFAWLGSIGFTLASLLTFGPYAAKLPLTDAFKLLSGTLGSDTGATFLARLALLALGGLAVAQFLTMEPARDTRERWLRGGTVLGCSAAVAATWSFAGHGLLNSPVALSVAVDIVHLTAMGVLAGGLLTLCLRKDAPVRWFSRLAPVGAGLLVLTGLYESWRQLGGFGAVTTLPGWLWVGVLALTLVLVGLGLAALRWRRRFLVVTGAGLAGLLLAPTAVLAITQPPSAPHLSAQPAPARLNSGEEGQDTLGFVDLAMVPTKVGTNELNVTMLDNQDVPKDGVGVTAVLNPPNKDYPAVPVQLTRVGVGYSVGSASIPGPGQWELALTLQNAEGKQQTIYGVVDVAP